MLHTYFVDNSFLFSTVKTFSKLVKTGEVIAKVRHQVLLKHNVIRHSSTREIRNWVRLLCYCTAKPEASCFNRTSVRRFPQVMYNRKSTLNIR